MARKPVAKAAKTTRAETVTVAARFDPGLAERMRNACYWSRIGVNDLVSSAVSRELDRMEKANGAPFKKRPAELRPGRKVSA